MDISTLTDHQKVHYATRQVQTQCIATFSWSSRRNNEWPIRHMPLSLEGEGSKTSTIKKVLKTKPFEGDRTPSRQCTLSTAIFAGIQQGPQKELLQT